MQSLQKTEFHLSGQKSFARLFPELKPLDISEANLKQIARDMAKREGRCTDSECVTNGLAIFGQFLAHDITFEVTSKFRGINRPMNFENHRSINLDLDCLYGQFTQDFLYDKDDREKLLLGKCHSDDKNNEWQDLQRNKQDKAIIPDARNDENIIVSRMQVLFIEFHNALIDYERKACGKHQVFKNCRQQTIWHYQWLIIHEFLKKILDEEVFAELLEKGSTFYCNPNILPLEFTGAAFRMGHSQTRAMNRISADVEKGLFELGAFETMEEYVDWHYLFDFEDGKVQYAKQLDTIIEKIFHNIPFINASDPIQKSLAYRNLKRGLVYGLPSGEDLARRMSLPVLQIELCQRLGLDGTPLWYYILAEAEQLGKGEHLGPLGSRLVGEVFFTVLSADNNSFLKVHPNWQPSIGRAPGVFEFTDLICFVEAAKEKAKTA